MNDTDIRNAENLAAWRKRCAQHRGSSYLSVDSFPDLRNQDQLRQWRTIEFKRRQTGLSKRSHAKVVNLAAWYLRKALNRKSA